MEAALADTAELPTWTAPNALFTGPEICRVVGLTYRQLDYWCRIGVIVPDIAANGSGTQRAFTIRQVPTLRVLGQLNAVGAGATQLRNAYQYLSGLTLAQWQGKMYVTPGGYINRKMMGPVNLVVDLDKTRADMLVVHGHAVA